MSARILKMITLVGLWCLGTGCSSTEELRDKYISADLRKAEKMSKRAKKLDRKVSSNIYGYGSLPL